MKKYILLFFCFVAYASLISCKNSLVSSSQMRMGSYCAPAYAYSYNAAFAPLENSDSLLQKDTILAAALPEHTRLMANATGTVRLIHELVRLKKDTSIASKLQLLEVEEQIQRRLLLVQTEINGITAELDCEGEKSGQLANYLSNLNTKRNTRLMVASIVVGAITTVATVLLNNNSAQNGVAIGGGLLSAGLGAMTINPSGKKIKFEHNRNLLEEIWFGSKTTKYYPPCVWYMLNEKKFSNDQQHSLRENIKTRWQTFELNNKVDSAKEYLLFRYGGLYTAEQLALRSSMLNQLQSTVRSMDQDMQIFMQALNTIIVKK